MSNLCVFGQGGAITTFQYRQVPADKLNELIKRETTYWSKVASKAIEKGNLTFWAFLVKVTGTDLATSPNVLFINTYNDIDGNMGDVWNASAVFPGVAMDKMDTYGMGKVVGEYFLKGSGWVQSSNVTGDNDFKYIMMVYQNSQNPSHFVALENRYWAPFIQSAMNNKQTSQLAWGNSIVLAPSGGPTKFNSVSYDLFPSLKTALIQDSSSNLKLPLQLFDSLRAISPNIPHREIYKIIKTEMKR
ncbi:MAG: hypothetical protein NVSMB67_24620 [Flavisolibacter sp.]